jgi:choline dehydrogenase
MPRKEFDYIIVGGGSAGSVLANRLSADPAISVLLVEAGPRDSFWRWTVTMPAAYGINFQGGRYNYSYHSEPEPELGGRRIFQPRGRILGGSSGINGMCYTRASPLDYERWVTEGAAGWSYADVLPYFKRLESTDRGDDLYRGRSGPVKVVGGPCAFPVYDAFFEAGSQLGYGWTDDFNGRRQEGFGIFERNIDNGVRASASWAYLRPIRRRANLTILTDTVVARVLFENARATGIEIVRDGHRREIQAGCEVILSGGAINTPQILLWSGVGPSDDLRSHDIPVVCDLPGVGRNLQDHYEFYLSWICDAGASLNPHLTNLGKLKIGAEWLLKRTGPGTSNHCEAAAFVKSDPSLGYPDIQLQFMPLQLASGLNPQPSPAGFCITIAHQRPTSRGRVTLRSRDPREAPALTLNYLSTERDRANARRCVELARDLIAQKAFSGLRGDEMKPGPQIASAAGIEAFCRQTGTSGYHASGTCRMGADSDPMVVATPDGRVRGLDALRVVDASLFPSLTTGNTNAPVMMMAEKLADQILGRPPLAQIDAPFEGRL